MSETYRSNNPDLLFFDIMRQRTEITTRWWSENRGEVPQFFDRFTVFVTHRCNLFCAYCTGPHKKETLIPQVRRNEMLRSDLSFKSFSRLLADVANGNAKIRHVHFTGGEPTLNKALPKMVELTTANKFLSSITTNGTADPALYRELVECGLTEIRVSLDSCDAQKFDALVKVKGAFAKTLCGIKEIVRLRDQEKKNVFLVINSCVGQVNLDDAERTLRFLLDLNPDDVKFLVIVQDREYVSDHKDDALKLKLLAMLNDYPKDRFPLLRTKISQMFDKDAIGLKDEQTQCVMEHCFLPLMERTLDARYYYPCSIYARYGNPIGRIAESLIEQQKKTEEFVANHDCRKDSICLANCVNCCKRFNINVNSDLKNFVGLIEADDVLNSEVEKIKTMADAINKGSLEPKKFLIVKPSGMAHKDRILDILHDLQIPVLSVEKINKWDLAFASLFYGLANAENAKSSLTHSKGASTIEKGAAEVWHLPDDLTYEKLGEAKKRIREKILGRVYIVKPKNTLNQERLFRLNAVHTPDSDEEAKQQLLVIAYFQNKITDI